MSTGTIFLPAADPAADLVREINGIAQRPTPAAAVDATEALLRQAENHGTKKAKQVAVRIRHDIDLLQKLLAQSGEAAIARKKVEKLQAQAAKLQAQIAAAEAELREKTAVPERNIARLAGSGQPIPAATTREMRAWLLANGHAVSERGRLAPDLIAIYEAAHPGGESA
jgi:hypothetical protein